MILPWTERSMEKEGDRSLIITKKFQGMFICSICFFSTTEDVGVKDRVLVYEKRIVYQYRKISETTVNKRRKAASISLRTRQAENQEPPMFTQYCLWERKWLASATHSMAIREEVDKAVEQIFSMGCITCQPMSLCSRSMLSQVILQLLQHLNIGKAIPQNAIQLDLEMKEYIPHQKLIF